MEVVEQTIFEKYPAYKDSGEGWLGKIPDTWELTRLGTRFIERRSKVSDKDFAPLSVTKHGIVPQLANAAKSNDGDNRKLVMNGDFVINSRSDRKGSSGIAFENGSVSLINIVMEPKGIHPFYCNYLLKSNGFIEEYYRNGHGIVADLWTTRYDEMKNIKIGIPTLQEQTAIAKFLDEKTEKIDQAIAQKQQLIALLKERKQILIQQAVTKGLDPNVKLKHSGIDWIGEIPEHWEVKKLKFLIKEKLKYGANESGVEYSKNLPRYIRITDFGNDGKLSEKNKLSLTFSQSEGYHLADGDILFARSGATVGKTYQFNSSMSSEGSYAFAGYLIKASVNHEILSDFLYLYTNSPFFYKWKDSIYNKATIENIGADKYANLFVIVPPYNEQQELLSELSIKFSKIDGSIRLQERQIEQLREYKSVLIDSAVTGKIKVC